jgi:hypothetical protein
MALTVLKRRGKGDDSILKLRSIARTVDSAATAMLNYTVPRDSAFLWLEVRMRLALTFSVRPKCTTHLPSNASPVLSPPSCSFPYPPAPPFHEHGIPGTTAAIQR